MEDLKTFGGEANRYFGKYPHSRPLKVAKAICGQLHLPVKGPDFRRKMNEARQIKHRVLKRINATESDNRRVLEQLVNGGLLPSAHRVVGLCHVPVWLGDAIAKGARECFGGWRAAGNGRLRSGMLVCRLPGKKYRMVFQPRTGRLDFFGGRGRVDFDDFKETVAGNLLSLVDLFCISPVDSRLLKEDLRSLLGEVWSGAASYHLAIPAGGMEGVVPFKIRLAYLGITVRHDGSHPSCIEIEVNEPRWIRELLHFTSRQEPRGIQAHLRDLDEERPHWQEEFRMVPMGLLPVQVSKIVGSVGHGRDFGPDWMPFVEGERDRLLVESFKVRGFDPDESSQSPISLVEYAGEYFVESDGHRRVSAARRLGLQKLEAEVYQLQSNIPQR